MSMRDTMLCDHIQWTIKCRTSHFLSLSLFLPVRYKAIPFFTVAKGIVVLPFIYFVSKRFICIFFMISQWKWNLFHSNFVYAPFIFVHYCEWRIMNCKKKHSVPFWTFTVSEQQCAIFCSYSITPTTFYLSTSSNSPWFIISYVYRVL